MEATSAPFGLPELVALMRGESAHKGIVMVGTAFLAIFVIKVLAFIKEQIRIMSGLASIPDAPGRIPFLGHVVPLATAPSSGLGAWDLMEKWMEDKKTDIVKFRILNTQGIAVRGPQAMKRIFQTRQKTYAKELQVSYHPFLPILGTGLVTSDGALWQKQRTLIGPALKVEILGVIISIAKRAVDRLTSKLSSVKGTGVAVDVEEEFRLLTLQVIGEAVLSMLPEDCDRVFPQLYLPVMEEANRRVLRPYRKYLPIPEWFRFRSRMNQLNAFLIGFMRKRWQDRQAGSRAQEPDILDKIMASLEESGAKWSSELETQLCYEVKTFLLAGHETSAAMLTWSLYEMTQAPEIMNKVQAEAAQVFGSTETAVDPSIHAVQGMDYTHGVLKEALRKYSVVPVVTRTVVEDDEVCGHKVPRGTMVACHLQGTHNMWKDAAVFSPDRFLPGGEYEQFDDADRLYMFLPFIQGPRNCLGQHLALLEARVVLGLLVKRFQFRLARSANVARSPTVIPTAPIGGMPMYVD